MTDTKPKMLAEQALPGLQVERFLDSATGQVEVHYLWNGAMVPKVKLEGKIAEQISGLTLIQKDLANAKRWIERASKITAGAFTKKPDSSTYFHATDRETFDEAKALFVAALTFYGKAFTEAAGRKAQLQRDWLAAEFRAMHDFYIDFRHNFAAHSGDSKVEQATSYLLLIPNSKGGTTMRLATSRLQPDLASSGEGDTDFLKLLDHAISVVDTRYFESGKRLVEAAVTRPPAFWFSAAQGNAEVDMDMTLAKTRKRRKT